MNRLKRKVYTDKDFPPLGWDSELTIPANAVKLGLDVKHARYLTRKFKLPYAKMSMNTWRRNIDNNMKQTDEPTDRQQFIRRLVSRFHRGDNSVIRKLLEFGIKARREFA